MATNFLSAVGYTILSYTLRTYAVLHYVCWTLPRCAWLHYTGQIPPPADPSRFSETDIGKDGKF